MRELRKETEIHISKSIVHSFRIRNERTPKGDGNQKSMEIFKFIKNLIRENITPRGDGNSACNSVINCFFYK